MDNINIIELLAMYAGQASSPYTTTTGDLDASATTVTVADASVLPSTIPFPLTLGFDASSSETVLVTEKAGNVLTITRAWAGSALTWVAGTKCARIFSSKDLNDLQDNAISLSQGVDDAKVALSLAIYGQRLHNANNDADIANHTKEIVGEVGTLTMTNSSKYPFNNSQVTVSLAAVRDTVNYAVEVWVTNNTGNVGEIEISDKLTNGFKINFTGSGTSVTVKYKVTGGFLA